MRFLFFQVLSLCFVFLAYAMNLRQNITFPAISYSKNGSYTFSRINKKRVLSARFCKTSGELLPIDEHGNTALHYAALRGDLSTAQHLLKRGANPNAQNWHGRTAAHKAIQFCKDIGNQTCLSLLKLLKEYHADLTLVDNNGDTLLHTAALGDHSGLIDDLMLLPINPKALNNDFLTYKDILDIAHFQPAADIYITAKHLQKILSQKATLPELYGNECEHT